jgi:hypothetical protein
LRDAGFGSVGIERFDADVTLSSDSLEEAVDFAMHAGPAARLLGDAPAELQASVRRDLQVVLSEQRTQAGFALAASAWLVHAH